MKMLLVGFNVVSSNNGWKWCQSHAHGRPQTFFKKVKKHTILPGQDRGGKGASAPSCPPLLTPMAMPGQLMYPNLGSFT